MSEVNENNAQNESQKPQPGTPEYDQYMIAKGRGGFRDQVSQQEQVQRDAPTKPDHIPAKFWNAETGQIDYEGLAKSYTELESKLGAGQKTDEKQGQEQQQQPEEKSDEQKVAEAAGLEWDKLESEFAQTGTISDEQIAAIEKIGIPRSIIETHIEAVKMSRQYLQVQTQEYAGGKDKLDFVLKQASEQLPPEEIDRYNAMLAGADWKIAIDALKAKFLPDDTSSFGDGSLFGGLSGANGSTVAPFQSKKEMSAAINARDERGNRKYDTDPAYRAEVQRRLQAAKKQRLF